MEERKVCIINLENETEGGFHSEIAIGNYKEIYELVEKYVGKAFLPPEEDRNYGLFMSGNLDETSFNIRSHYLDDTSDALWDVWAGLSDTFDAECPCGYRVYLDGKVIVDDYDWDTSDDLEKKEAEFKKNTKDLIAKLADGE